MRAERGAVLLATVAGASAWLSAGDLAVTSDRVVRVGALPAWWWLPIGVVGGMAVAWLTRLRTADAWPLLLCALLWLPWLPVSVPAPFLLWEGPLEVAVWIAALMGSAVASSSLLTWPVWTPLRRLRAAVVTIVVGATCLSLMSAAALSERIPGGDEPHYLIITQSLLSDGDLRIENNHLRGDFFAYFNDGLPPDFLQRGVDGQIYSIHAPGVSALVLPVFAVAGYPGAVALIALLSAMGLAAAWVAAAGLTRSAPAAWASALALGFSATHFFHSFVIFPDPVGGAVVSVAMALIMALATAPSSVRPWHTAVVGVLLGMLPWLHTRFAILAGVLGVVIVLRVWPLHARWRHLAGFAAGPAVLAVGWFAYFWMIYGTLDPAAPYGNSQQNDAAWIPRGLLGLLFDQQYGVVANAPALAMAALGWLWLCRLHPRLAVEWLLVVVPYVLVVASFGMWWGGWSAPGRFLVAVVPLAAPLLALAWQRSGAAGRSVFVALTLLGAGNVIARIVVLDGLLLYNVRDGYDLLLDWLSRSVNLPAALPGVHRAADAVTWRLAALWSGAALLMWAALRVSERWHGFGGRWTRTALCGVAAASLALAAGWRVSRLPVVTPETSEIAFLQAWTPAHRPVGVALPSIRLRPLEAVLASLDLRSSIRVRNTDPRVVLRLPWVPAGHYRVMVDGARELSGTLAVSVGMTSQLVETWDLQGRSSGDTGLRLDLPALVHSVTMSADAEAAARITTLSLRPERVPDAGRGGGEYVIRAGRFADIRVFLLDDFGYLEPDGIWTRGNSTARMALTGEPSRTALSLQAGPVETTVMLTSGEWQQELRLAPGERQRVEVPVGGVLEVETRGLFRPSDHDEQSRDQRPLGVRLELPPPISSE